MVVVARGLYLARHLFTLSSPRAESARAVTGRRCPHSGRGEDFLTGQLNIFTETAVTPEQKVEKLFPRWEINRHCEGKNKSLTKIGVVWQKLDFWTKNRNFGPKKRRPLLNSNHVLATTGKSCSKKKSAFAQIIKGGYVILGDFLG